MWVAKIKINIQTGLISSRAIKHGLNIFGFPLSYFYQDDWVVVNVAGTILGDKKKINEFCKDLKSSNRTQNLELNDNFIIARLKEPRFMEIFYNSKIIHLNPVFFDTEGFITCVIGSFDRNHLQNTIKMLEDNFLLKLFYFKQKKIKNISVMQQNPELTEKQKTAIEIAIKNGYYDYPRKIELEKLAKIMKLSYSTYQAHLRKAEQKLIPYYYDN